MDRESVRATPFGESAVAVDTGDTAGHLFRASPVLPGLFCRDRRAGNTPCCVYIPPEQLRAMTRSANPVGAGVQVIPDSIHCDDLEVYPVVLDGTTVAVTTDPAEDTHWSSKSLPATDTSQRALKNETEALRLASEWLTDLYRRDLTFDMFLKALLRRLVAVSADSVGAVYYESGDGYRLRLASGSLSGHPVLTPYLEGPESSNWLAVAEELRPVQYNEQVPSNTCALDSPPCVYMSFAGPETPQGASLIIVGIPADITGRSLATLRQIARLGARLSAADFVSVADAWPALARVAGQYYDRAALVDVMQELLVVLRRLAPLTRLVLSSESGPAWVVTYSERERATARIDRRPPVPRKAFDSVDGQRSALSNQPAHDFDEPDLADRYKRDRVACEFYVPAPLPGGRSGLLAAGADAEIIDPAGLEPILVTVAGFLSLYATSTGQPIDTVGGVDEAGVSSEELAARQRMETLRKLSIGYFHALRSRMLVISGHADLIGQSGGSGSSAKPAEEIAQAVDQASELLERLSRVTDLGKEEARRTISLQTWVHELPEVLYGYARYVLDTRNVSLAIEPSHQCPGDLVLTKQEAYDTVIPVLLTLMDEAVCSGTVSIGLHPIDGGCGLLMEFGANIAGHLDLSQIIADCFSHRPIEQVKPSLGTVDLISLKLSFESTQDGRCRLMLQAKPPYEEALE